jgi:hypothetical protein
LRRERSLDLLLRVLQHMATEERPLDRLLRKPDQDS